MDVILPDVKPAIEELSPSNGGPVDDNSGSSVSGQGQVSGSPNPNNKGSSNNNTIKTLSPQQAKALQQQNQISTSSTSGGGTVYINSANSGGAILTNSTIPPPPSSVRTSTILTTAPTVASRQQLQTMAKSAGLNIVHVTLPQSVIQSPSSVIHSASGQIQLSKGNVILLSSKAPSGVIQATSGALQAVQLLESQQQQLNHSDDGSLSNDDGVDLPPNRAGGGGDRKRREILTRRPSYRKILNDLGGAEITGERGDSTATTSESSQDGLEDDGSGNIIIGGQSYPQSVVKVLNANALGLSGASSADAATSLQTITMTNAGGTGGTLVQYAHPDGQPFYVPGNHWTSSPVSGDLQAYTIRPMSSANSNTPVVVHGGGGGGHQHHPPEEQTRKREIRLLKNREAARECRRKKKEYIKCLENRVAVLENQNKALIDELKSLKELYCQQKVE